MGSGVSDNQRAVLEFQRAKRCAEPRSLKLERSDKEGGEEANGRLLRNCARDLEIVADALARRYSTDQSDQRLIRGKLQVGEMAELLDALADRDEVAALDALADNEYVNDGTAATYDLPLQAAFEEVHRSNMTKSTVESSIANHTGDRGKGEGYSPPNLWPILLNHRAGVLPQEAAREEPDGLDLRPRRSQGHRVDSPMGKPDLRDPTTTC